MTIYFIQMESEGWIKIGFTAGQAERRMAQLQTGQPQKLTLLGTIPGDIEAERGLHRHFKQTRIQGEWFKPSYGLVRAIAELIKHQHPWYFCRKWPDQTPEEIWEDIWKDVRPDDYEVWLVGEVPPFPEEKIRHRKNSLKNLRALASKMGSMPEWLAQRIVDENLKIEDIRKEWLQKLGTPEATYVAAWMEKAA